MGNQSWKEIRLKVRWRHTVWWHSNVRCHDVYMYTELPVTNSKHGHTPGSPGIFISMSRQQLSHQVMVHCVSTQRSHSNTYIILSKWLDNPLTYLSHTERPGFKLHHRMILMQYTHICKMPAPMQMGWMILVQQSTPRIMATATNKKTKWNNHRVTQGHTLRVLCHGIMDLTICMQCIASQIWQFETGIHIGSY